MKSIRIMKDPQRIGNTDCGERSRMAGYIIRESSPIVQRMEIDERTIQGWGWNTIKNRIIKNAVLILEERWDVRVTA